MRKIVFQMMTTLNGRLDDPGVWVSGIGESHYKEIDKQYAAFDTILVGQTTYDEMHEYWPGAETNEAESETTRSMARKMNSYKKYVISDAPEKQTLAWANAEHTLVHNDEELVNFVNQLKAQNGGNIHLSGGARLAQSIIRLGLVDEYHFFVYPTVSKGAAWFDQIEDKRDLELLSAQTYENGVVGLYYKPKS
ncbi:MAG TPA: dihydrofolate reductase family protein [Candidatus Saccharimonadales bacterium]|nr:dihydrofolate reductase family protein [Candidatus Saccharimonadales bacterium]